MGSPPITPESASTNADVYGSEVTWGGGITFAKKAAALAEAFAKPIAFHDCSGPVTLACSAHLALVCPNVVEQEITRGFYYGWYHELVEQAPPIKDGFLRLCYHG